MASFNRVILAGNVTRDIELRQVGAGASVCDVGMAVNDRKKSGDEWVEETTFIDVTLWGRTAEIASQYLQKGSPVLIEGKLKMESWEDKTSGAKRSKLKVNGERMQLLGAGGGKASPTPSRPQQQAHDDDLSPF